MLRKLGPEQAGTLPTHSTTTLDGEKQVSTYAFIVNNNELFTFLAKTMEGPIKTKQKQKQIKLL